MFGLGIGRLGAIARAINQAFSPFSPSSLFANNEPGALYDPSDFDRYMSQTGPELVTNGTFDSDLSGWGIINIGTATASVSDGAAQVTNVNAQGGIFQNIGGLVAGRGYKVSLQVIPGSVNGIIQIGSAVNTGSLFQVVGASGAVTGFFTATSTSTFISLRVNGVAGATCSFDNISVKELTAIDTATLFQDAAGTTPVTAVEQPVGLLLDKSKGLVLGPELVTNGDFSAGTTGWTASGGATISVENGRLKVVAGASNGAFTSITCQIGKRYKLTFNGFPDTGTVRITVGNAFAQGDEYDSGSNSASNTSFSVIFTAGRTTEVISTWSGSGGTSYYDNLSVRELPGNHAFQTTSASRPVLSARVNLLTKTEQFDDAVWVKSGVTATTGRLQETTATGLHWVAQGTTAAAGTYTYCVEIKSSGRSYAFVQIGSSGATTGVRAIINLSSGTVESFATVGGGGFTTISSTTTSASDGYWLVTIVATVPANQAVYLGSALDASTVSYAGDGASGVLVQKADLRVSNDGIGLPAYQRVSNASDYDTTGFPLYLRFDGVDDWLQTNTITPGTDKAQVFAGVRKLSDAASGVVVESSVTSSANAGSLNLIASSGNLPNYAARAFGSADNTGTFSTYIAPRTDVIALALSTVAAAAASAISGRINGAVAALTPGNSNASTGNYLAYPLYIGRRGGTSLPFNGRLYPLIVRFGPTLTDAQIASTEAWVNGKTRAYAP